ncbi:TonB-dependent receptor [Croceicoccus estronivorus]|uniref:TonB-dependent receptor n=1 Tax=Croceicoccus estronivorus TaxID=1172626 RepID=UPI00082B6EE7|nr:TonB-dependent receptor [Croceicoccus estronivorus]OCC23287.1 TonB-dependent receptor [Croceicoccus estronivorus]
MHYFLGRNRYCALSALMAACASPAFAQTAESGGSVEDVGVSEIVVTAQRREESQLATPISVVALSQAQLANKSVFDITDLPRAVPNLQVGPHPNSANTARVFIRGIGNSDDQFTQDPSVAIYVDGVYVARTQGMVNELAEIERIEVLRGPQGTLYGRNATGGAINYITRAPELGAFHARQDLLVGNYDQFRSRTTVNVPLGETLAVQGGILYSRKDGFIRNPGTGSDRFGDQRHDAYRGAVRWQPTADIDIVYTYDRSHTRDTPPYLAVVPLYPAKPDRPGTAAVGVTGLTPNRTTSQGHSLTASWDILPTVQLKSITAYRKLSSAFRQFYFPGTLAPSPLLTQAANQRQHQFSEELQIIGSTADGSLEFVLGGYYFDEDGRSAEETSSIFAATENRAVTIGNTAYAAYGQATYRPGFASGVYVTGGLRWSKDERRASLTRALAATGGGTPPPPTFAAGDVSFSNVSPTVILGYSPNDDLNVYAKYAKGYKSGGFNIRASTTTRFADGFGPEAVDSYEIGLKTALFDRRVRFNLAAFRYDYKDIQINVITDPANPTITDTFNAGGARIKGIEADVTARPIRSMLLGLNYAYLDAKYTRILDGVGNDVTNRYQFQNAPKHSFSANLTQSFPETPIGRPEIYVNYSWQSKRFANTGDAALVFKSLDLLDARISLTDIPLGGGRWTLAAFGKNLLDEDYYVHHFRAVLPGAIFGEPRTYGLQLTFEY